MCGPYVSPVGKLVGRGRTADEWKWAVESFQKIAPHAQQAGVVLGLEELPLDAVGGEPEAPGPAKGIAGQLGHSLDVALG